MPNVLDNLGAPIIRFRVSRLTYGRDCDGAIAHQPRHFESMKPECLARMLGEAFMRHARATREIQETSSGYEIGKFSFYSPTDEGFTSVDIDATDYTLKNQTPCDCENCA